MVNVQELSSRRLVLREAVAASAERIISEHGYQALRARDVAQDVGCAVGAIYNVFADMDALVLAVKERTLDFLAAEITRRIAPGARPFGDDPIAAKETALQNLLKLAELYLDFASKHAKLWQAVFEYRSADPVFPETYAAKLDGILKHIEQPLEILVPALAASERQLVARALLSAVHGIVALGLDQKLGPLSAESLRWQVRTIVRAAATGLASLASPEIAAKRF